MPEATHIPAAWEHLIRDWTRALQAENKSPKTIRIYTDAAKRLAVRAGVDDPAEIDRAAVRDHIAHLVQSTSAGNAHTNFRALQQWFKFLVAEDELEKSPMLDMKPPIVPEQPVPVVSDEMLQRVLATCEGKDFVARRDTALLRIFFDTGARRSEIAGLMLDDVDLETDTIHVFGKGRKARTVPFSPSTGRALTRYLRARSKHARASNDEHVWLGERGRGPLTSNGIGQMLKRRGMMAGFNDEVGRNLHAHLGRHSVAHQWQAAGGSAGDLMLIMGWKSPTMPLRYGASAAVERAHAAARKLRLGDRV